MKYTKEQMINLRKMYEKTDEDLQNCYYAISKFMKEESAFYNLKQVIYKMDELFDLLENVVELYATAYKISVAHETLQKQGSDAE